MRARFKLIALIVTLVVMAAAQANTSSPNYRIEGSSFVTTAAAINSSNFTMALAGGSGSPVGPVSSPSFIVISGPALIPQPEEPIFNSSFE